MVQSATAKLAWRGGSRMPVVTITRQIGSEGDTVGRALAERLDFRFLDRTNLIQTMRTYGSEVEPTAPEIQEKQPTFWERLNEERRRHTIMLRCAVYSTAVEDNCVIVGVGASVLLKGLSHVLKTLTIAPLETRVSRVAEHGTWERPGPTDREAAQELVKSRDREVAGYLRYLFNVDYTDPRLYDVVLNTARWQVPQAAAYLGELLQLPEIVKSAESAQRLDDLALASLVEVRLVNNTGIWVHGLRATAEHGEVTITGEVITDEDREVAEEVAISVPGVRGVINELRIQPPPLTGM
jgi:cytidylate kinase